MRTLVLLLLSLLIHGCHDWDGAARDCTLENGCRTPLGTGGSGGPTVPAPPTGVTATAGTRQGHVKWVAPANNGGSELTEYTVTSSPGARSATVPASQLETDVTGLADGTTYTFTVVAANAQGPSEPSAPSNAVTTDAVPGAPGNVTAMGGAAQAIVMWTPPTNTGTGAITGYTITATPGGGTTAAGAAATQVTVTGLVNGTSYTFTVRASNAIGIGPESSPSNAVTPATVPGAPTAVTATPGNGEALIKWTIPTDSGGSAIISYTVTSSPGGFTATVMSAVATQATVTGLTNGVAYTFTVFATNAVGNGPASMPTTAVMPVAVPASPTSVVATRGNARATVQWVAPTNTGGSALTGFTVTSNPGGLSMTVGPTVLQTDVTGLTNGTSYTFTVVATNASGNSLPSAPSNAVTPATVPGAPTGVTAVPSSGAATVSWTAPLDDGGSVITQYVVTSSPGGFMAMTGGSGRMATVMGLVNGTSYTFTVVAVNALGSSVASLPSNAVVPATLPGAPTAVSATRGDQQATVQWNAPVSTGGSAIISYTVTSTPGAVTATVGGGASQATVPGLLNGQPYTFTVHATNAIGNSGESGASTAVTPAGTPFAPSGVTATPGPSQATVQWTAGAANGTPITGFIVTSNPGGFTASAGAGATSAMVTGLSNATSYTFTVAATNAVGTGQASMPSSPVVPFTVPDAPTNVLATFGNMQATLQWTAPFDQGRPITAYTVNLPDGGIGATTTGATMATVASLVNGQSYTFTVKASNVAGPGASSTPSNPVVPATVPGVPRFAEALSLNASAKVSWRAPVQNGGSAVTGYVVTASPGGAMASVGAGATTATVSGLSNGVQYTFTVAATNIAGTGTGAMTNAVTPEVPCTGKLLFDAGTFTPNPGSEYEGVAALHVDNDATIDLVVGNGSGLTYENGRMLGSGTGTFASFVDFGFNSDHCDTVVAADLNRDGLDDVAMTCGDDATIGLNTGSGGFSFVHYDSGGASSTQLVCRNFDGDPAPDIVTARPASVSRFLRNNGSGALATPVSVGPPNADHIAAADFNSDTLMDIAVSQNAGSPIVVRLGDGDGGFVTAPGSPGCGGTDCFDLVAEDFDRDGVMDVATLTVLAGPVTRVAVQRGLGNGTLAAPVHHATPLSSSLSTSDLVAHDLNGDGILDLLVDGLDATTMNPILVILLGNAAGGFGTASTYPIVASPRQIAVADFNRDGRLDIVIGSSSVTTMSRFIRNGCM